MACNSCNSCNWTTWNGVSGIQFPDFVANSCCNPCCESGSVGGTSTCGCSCHSCGNVGGTCGCGCSSCGNVSGNSTCGCNGLNTCNPCARSCNG